MSNVKWPHSQLSPPHARLPLAYQSWRAYSVFLLVSSNSQGYGAVTDDCVLPGNGFCRQVLLWMAVFLSMCVLGGSMFLGYLLPDFQ